jgi:ribosomal protein S30
MKKERKGTMPKEGLVHSQSPSVPRHTSNKPHPNATNAMQYREQIDESCLPY